MSLGAAVKSGIILTMKKHFRILLEIKCTSLQTFRVYSWPL